MLRRPARQNMAVSTRQTVSRRESLHPLAVTTIPSASRIRIHGLPPIPGHMHINTVRRCVLPSLIGGPVSSCLSAIVKSGFHVLCLRGPAKRGKRSIMPSSFNFAGRPFPNSGDSCSHPPPLHRNPSSGTPAQNLPIAQRLLTRPSSCLPPAPGLIRANCDCTSPNSSHALEHKIVCRIVRRPPLQTPSLQKPAAARPLGSGAVAGTKMYAGSPANAAWPARLLAAFPGSRRKSDCFRTKLAAHGPRPPSSRGP